MTCDELRPLLAGFVDGELEPDQVEAVASHVATCDDCAEELGRQEEVGALVADQVPMPSGDAWDEWQVDLEGALGVAKAPRIGTPIGRVVRVAVGLAAAVLITVTLVGRLSEPPPAVLAYKPLPNIMMSVSEPQWREADPVAIGNLLDVDGWEGANLTPPARDLLGREGLVQVPSAHGSVADHFDAPAPNAPRTFVTADTSLLLYGGVADSAALALERAFLIPGLKRLLALLDAELRAIEVRARTDQVRASALFARRRFAVAAILEGLDPNLEAADKKLCQDEVERIRAATETKASLILGRKVDYRRCAPTGFYLGDAALRDHVRAIHWLRLSGFVLEAAKHPRETRAAGLVVLALARGRFRTGAYAGRNGLWLQGRLEAAVEVLFGEPDELTPFDLLRSLRQGLQRWRLSPSDLVSGEALTAFAARAKVEAIAKGTGQVRGLDDGPGKTPTIRMVLLGNTRSLEGRALSALSAPALPGRSLPSSLDLLALLGSRRALTVVSTLPGFSGAYEQRLEALQTETKAWRTSDQPIRVRSSLEHGRLWSLAPLLARPPRRMPFQASTRYRGRLLLAALGGLNSPAPSLDVVPHSTPQAGALPLVEPLPRLHARLAFSAERLAQALTQIDEQIGPKPDLRRAILRLRRVAWLEEGLRDASLALLEDRKPSAAVTHTLRCTGSILRRLGPQRWSSAEDVYELETPDGTRVLHRVVQRLDRLVVVTLDPETGRATLAAGPAMAARELVTEGERLSGDDPTALAGDDPVWAEHTSHRSK